MTVKRSTKRKAGSEQAAKTGVDNRDDHRIPIQLLVDYKSNGTYLFDFCRDLGSGGVFIETKSPLESGSDVDLTFTLPDSKETLVTTGKVIWVQTETSEKEGVAGMGVQFTSFSKEDRHVLEDFITRYNQNKNKDIVDDKTLGKNKNLSKSVS